MSSSDVVPLGTVYPLLFEVIDPDTGCLADPTSWSLSLLRDGVEYATPTVDHPATGQFTYDVAAAQTGVHTAVFTASGTLAGQITDLWVVSGGDLAVVTIDQLRLYLRSTSATDAELANALAAERIAQTRHCEIDPYTEDLREALLCRVGRNIAARRTPAAQVNSFTGTTAGISTAAQYASEVERLEQPVRVVGFA